MKILVSVENGNVFSQSCFLVLVYFHEEKTPSSTICACLKEREWG
jgi:hypothetical protein